MRCKWLICLNFSRHTHFPCAGRSMPACVALADDRPIACHGRCPARRADRLKHRYGILSLQAPPRGGACQRIEAKHAGSGTAMDLPLAMASAFAFGAKSCSSAYCTCAGSYIFSSIYAGFQARPLPRAPASAALLSTASLATSAIPFVSRRPSRHRWLCAALQARASCCLDFWAQAACNPGCRAAGPATEEGNAS
jgi:hypothetical protein